MGADSLWGITVYTNASNHSSSLEDDESEELHEADKETKDGPSQSQKRGTDLRYKRDVQLQNSKVEVYEDQIRNLLGRISEQQSGLRPWDDGNQDLEGSRAAEIKTLEKEIEKLCQERDHRMTAWHEEQLAAADNGTELVRKRKENHRHDVAAQSTSVDNIGSELASRTHELQSIQPQLDDRTKQLQDAEALLNDRTDELHLIQTQLDDRTNQIQQMAITFESQAAEMNKLKEENERLRGEIDRLADDSQLATQDESLNLPNVSNQSSLSQQTSKKMKEMSANIQKLTEMNLQWQKYNQKRDTQMKKYEKEIEELKSQIRKFNISNEVFLFTEAQQERIDNHCQRIRREAEQTCGGLETALAEAQQRLRDCRQQMEEAEQRATVAIQQKDEVVERTSELQRQVEELNRQVTSLLQEAEELRAALESATRRHDHQAPPDQRLINNLKKKVDDVTRRFQIMAPQMNELRSKNRCYLSLVRRCLGLFEAIHTRDQATIDELQNELANAQRGRLLTDANEIAELRSDLEAARRECEGRDDLIETQMLNIRQLRELVADLSRRLARAADAHAVNNAGNANPRGGNGCCVIQ